VLNEAGAFATVRLYRRRAESPNSRNLERDERVQQTSKGILEVNQGSLYPALQRLEKGELIVSDWGETDNNRRARYYRLTAAGRRALGDELESWKRFVTGLDAVLRST
jgi:PadR family transcriptional regulator PadR